MDNNSNRLPIIIALVAVLGAGWFFMKAFKKKPSRQVVIEETTEEDSESADSQEKMGTPIKDPKTGQIVKMMPGSTTPTTALAGAAVTPEEESDRRMFAQVMDEMRDCLDLSRGGGATDAPVSVETLTNQLQGDFGTAASQGDRWYSWKLKTPGGEERLLRLDYFEDEMGNPQREMHYFSMRSETDVFPIDIPPDKSLNPAEGYVEQLLGDGQVNYSEKAKYSIFPSGERVDFVEKNGKLAEIEVTKGERFFRCDSVKDRQSCHCVKEE